MRNNHQGTGGADRNKREHNQQMENVPGITVINGSMDIQVNYKNKNGGNSIYCYSICTDGELQQLLKE